MSNLLARGGDVLGCDACESMLKRAAVKQGLQGKCVLANGTLLPFAANAADVTLCSFAAGYFPDVFQLVDELARVTRHGGRVLLTDLHPRAVAAGWTRSFRAGASVYEIEHYAHSEEYLCAAGECAGLTLEARLQFSLDEPERALFERAGKSNMFHKASLIPAIWIGVWRTP
jgi:ubiquinone/menaquinone biosynthesis C-methylase UbiE